MKKFILILFTVLIAVTLWFDQEAGIHFLQCECPIDFDHFDI